MDIACIPVLHNGKVWSSIRIPANHCHSRDHLAQRLDDFENVFINDCLSEAPDCVGYVAKDCLYKAAEY